MRDELRAAKGHGLLRMGHGLVPSQVVVRPIMDAADFFEAAEAFLFHLDVEVDLVVERALCLIELGEAERISRDPEPVEVVKLDRREVIDVPRGQIAGDEVSRGDIVRAGLVLLRRPGDADRRRRDRVEGQPVRKRRGVEEDLEFGLEKFPHAVGALARADLVSIRPPDDGEPHRKFPPQRLELSFEVEVASLGRLRPEVGAVLAGRPDIEREHHVERSGRSQFAFAIRASDLQVADAGVDFSGCEALVLFVRRGLDQLIPAVRFTTARARDEDVREVIHMAGSLESGLREDRRRVDEVVVVAQSKEGLCPKIFPPSAHENAVVAVVVETRESPIQIDRGPQEAAADAQRHDVVVGGHLPPESVASGLARRPPRNAISTISRAGTPPFIRATRYANSISRRREGVLIIALSVPSRSSTPCLSIRGMSGVIPKNAFDRGHTTIGTRASAQRSRSASVAWTLWTRNAGFRSITTSISSRTRSEQWTAKIFLARRTSAASFSMASRGQSM